MISKLKHVQTLVLALYVRMPFGFLRGFIVTISVYNEENICIFISFCLGMHFGLLKGTEKIQLNANASL